MSALPTPNPCCAPVCCPPDTVFGNGPQTFTVHCPDGSAGQSTAIVGANTHFANTQEDADAAALAEAQAAAQAALVCDTPPPIEECTAAIVETKIGSPSWEAAMSWFADGLYEKKTLHLTKGQMVELVTQVIGQNHQAGPVICFHGFATGGSSTTLVDAARTWAVDYFTQDDFSLYDNFVVIAGTGAGTHTRVKSNTSDTLTFWNPLGFTPDSTTEYLLFIGTGETGTQLSDSNNSDGYTYLSPGTEDYELRLFNTIGFPSRIIYAATKDDSSIGAIIPQGQLLGTAIDTTRNKLFVADYDKESFVPFLARYAMGTYLLETRVDMTPIDQIESPTIDYAPTTDKIYWAGRFSTKKVFEIDPVTLAITRTLSVSGSYTSFNGPTGVLYVPNGTNGYLILYGIFSSGKLVVVDLDTFTVHGSITCNSVDVVWSPSDGRVWAQAGSIIHVVDPAALAITHTITVGGATLRHGAWVPSVSRMYFGAGIGGGNSALYAINPSGYAVSGLIASPLSWNRPLAMCYRTGDDRVWVNSGYLAQQMEELIAVNPNTNLIVNRKMLGNDVEKMFVGANNHIFCNNFIVNAVGIINP